MRERKKNEIVEKQLLPVFLIFFCLSVFPSFFRVFFLLSCTFYNIFFHLYLREVSPMMSNKQTNKKEKKKNPIISASIAQSQRGFWGWNGELSSKQLDEHRSGVGGGGRSIKFMREGVKVQ